MLSPIKCLTEIKTNNINTFTLINTLCLVIARLNHGSNCGSTPLKAMLVSRKHSVPLKVVLNPFVQNFFKQSREKLYSLVFSLTADCMEAFSGLGLLRKVSIE